MEKRQEIYKGKAKSVFTTDDPDRVIMVYRNDTSAFDGKKVAQLDRKGMVNNKFNAFIMEKLAAAGVPTHFERVLSDNESLVKKLDMLPLECVVRNFAAGSIVRRYGVQEGLELNPPTFEFFLKSDALGDPICNESHILSFKWATQAQIDRMKELTLKINDVLKPLFLAGNMLLVDYKLEFGLFKGEAGTRRRILAGRLPPLGQGHPRKTRQGSLPSGSRQCVESYEQVGKRLGVQFD